MAETEDTLLHRIARWVERGKSDVASDHPPDMSGEEGAEGRKE